MDMMAKLEENEKNDDYDGIFVVQNIHTSVSKAWATHVRNVKCLLIRRESVFRIFGGAIAGNVFFVVEVSEDVFSVFPNLMYFT